MAAPFRVALSGDFRKPDGSPTFPDFDLAPLRSALGLEMAFLEAANPIRADQIVDFDALILLTPRFGGESIHPNGRLSVVARFGVGYDNVDVDACSAAGIALVITPDGVRRPVAVSVMALMLALTGKLMIKDRLTRAGPEAFNQRAQHMGVGLVGRTLGTLGVGNIGAELFRLAKPFDMTFIAHDPFADAGIAAELGIELVGLVADRFSLVGGFWQSVGAVGEHAELLGCGIIAIFAISWLVSFIVYRRRADRELSA